MSITSKTINYVQIGTMKFKARTEKQILEAIDKVFELDDEEGAVHNKMIKQELGL